MMGFKYRISTFSAVQRYLATYSKESELGSILMKQFITESFILIIQTMNWHKSQLVSTTSCV